MLASTQILTATPYIENMPLALENVACVRYHHYLMMIINKSVIYKLVIQAIGFTIIRCSYEPDHG